MCGNVSNSDRLERTFKQGLKSPLGNLGLIGLEQTTRFTGGSDWGNFLVRTSGEPKNLSRKEWFPSVMAKSQTRLVIAISKRRLPSQKAEAKVINAACECRSSLCVRQG